MLREIPHTRQHADEPHRRWFHCTEQDLYVWQSRENGEIVAFQLCYDKPTGEHAFYWRADKGVAHLQVNDGESVLSNQTPLLIADGHFPAMATRQRFDALADEIPVEIATFVRERLLSDDPSRSPK
ncbi:MAG TPA: hypothetical protein PLW86_04000 [Rhodocyclaceae bacterium]|nr:hypothetical protein [Rhodocyclaceae bacterium]